MFRQAADQPEAAFCNANETYWMEAVVTDKNDARRVHVGKDPLPVMSAAICKIRLAPNRGSQFDKDL